MSAPEAFPAAHIATEGGEGTVPIAEELLSMVLEPYSYKGCRYLVDAEYKSTGDSVLAYGSFRIEQPAYIRSTGHFNAVELVICFNQLAYAAFAPAIINRELPIVDGYSIADFFDNQLPSMLIRSTSSQFKKSINAQSFSARLLCENFRIIERTRRYLSIPCSIEFWDQSGGAASGQIELAVLNIP
ncbi:FcoT family thioesterase [Mycobacterium shigaense]|uniref:(2E)-enoyl-[ACP] glycyltransferase n=1 Tax=Mycobacterium shigaense TaxID=722731 RepID=A0A1Z4EK35_9MYCO|nr:FcoT family thioesterase [Mycobacterium shigaense]MEA1123097.1 FcoT family thioesterase [Mycobacterium shigaense]PRI15616.1 hypothetical protein B2J96_09540 [Mycobacterium shigaense]BAX93292.1 hypothetical protein MSG_03153 [Mycobacterium shigaense]